MCGITLHHPPPPDVAVKNEKKRIKIKLAEYSKAKVKSKAICARIEKATTKAEKKKANADCDESYNKTLAICSNGECDLSHLGQHLATHEMINDDEKQPADKVTGGGGEHPLGEKLPDGFEDNSGNNRSRGRGSISCQTIQYHFIS